MATLIKVFKRGGFMVAEVDGAENNIPILQFDYGFQGTTVILKDLSTGQSYSTLTATLEDDTGVIGTETDIKNYFASESLLGVDSSGGGTSNVDVVGNTVGLATGAKQDTGNASLSSIDGKLTDNATETTLSGIASTVSTEATLALVKTATEGVNTKLTAVTRTMTLVRKTDATGSPIAAGSREISVYNAGGADGTILGATIKAGETITFRAGGEEDTLAAFSYDGTGTELVIQTIV